jgi:hypothetical protein
MAKKKAAKKAVKKKASKKSDAVIFATAKIDKDAFNSILDDEELDSVKSAKDIKASFKLLLFEDADGVDKKIHKAMTHAQVRNGIVKYGMTDVTAWDLRAQKTFKFSIAQILKV